MQARLRAAEGRVMDCRKRKRNREREREKERRGGRKGDAGMEGANAFIYIYGIVDDATRAYVRFEMHKERARSREGINLQRVGGRGMKMAATFV